MITLTLETLSGHLSPTIRATSRCNGRTVSRYDGAPSQAKSLLIQALNDAGSGHRINATTYSLGFIELNDAAMAVFGIDKTADTLTI